MKNQKTILANWGGGNQGKSETLKFLISFFERDFPKAIFNYIRNDTDITVIITIGKIKIGIATQGDPNSDLEDSLRIFANREKCQITVCACRTYGMTTRAVEATARQHKYNLLWITNIRSTDNHDLLNRISAQQFLDLIKGFLI
jgi:hypothetical protein